MPFEFSYFIFETNLEYTVDSDKDKTVFVLTNAFVTSGKPALFQL